MCWRLLLLVVLPVLAAGCASVTVTKDPGPEDTGVRYYLPKPYLKLEQAKIKVADSETEYTPLPEMVAITFEMLPDYSEEYSVHVRAGVGINNTVLKLDKGWQLKEINCDIQSNFSQNVTEVANAIKAMPFPAPKQTESTDSGGKRLAHCAAAHNVPLGYYESVFTPGDCGKRQLLGWRYVGFAPFVGCPIQATGSQVEDCHRECLYGLVYENKTMVFKRLNALGK